MDSTMTTRRMAVMAVAVTLTALATGCGAADDGAPTPAAASTTTSDGAGSTEAGSTEAGATAAGAAVCELLTIAEAGDLFGATAAVDSDEKSTRECVWVGRQGALHQLHLQVYTGQSFYSPARWGGTGEPVTGLGDEAFLIRSSPLGVTAGTRNGEQVVFLNYQILLSANAKSADRADDVTQLLRTAVGRL
jgi:hypothetical protein